MKLMTQDLEARFAALGEQDLPATQVIVPVKFFCPWSNWTWYATSYDPDSQVFFGFVTGVENELGTFSLEELESQRGPMGLRIERDLYWQEQTLAQVMAKADR